MATAQSKLDILINAKQNASGPVKQLTGDLKSLDKQAGLASKGLAGLAVAGGIAGFATLAAGAVSLGVGLAEAGSRAEQLRSTLDRLANDRGLDGGKIMSSLQEVARGTITETELALNANRALIGGVAQNADDLAKLLQVAISRGAALGIGANQAFSDLTSGLAKGEVEILDNLGFIVRLEEATQKYADSVGKSRLALTAQERTQALVNEVLAQAEGDLAAAGDMSLNAAQKVDTLRTAWQELREEVGKEIAPVVGDAASDTAGLVGWVTKYLFGDEASMNRGVNEARIAIKQIQDELEHGFISSEHRSMLEAELRVQIQALSELTGASQRARFETGEVEAAFNRLGGASGVASSGFANVGLSASAAKEQLAQLEAQANETERAINQIKAQSLGALQAAASDAVSVMGSSEVSKIYADQKKRLDAQITTLQKYGYETDELRFKSQELAEKAALPFTMAVEAQREAEKGARSYGKTLSDEARAAEQVFSDLRSSVEGVLSGALNTGVTSSASILESLGLRPDAINEDARRLADVAVNGWASPWADYFRTQFPNLFDDMYFDSGNIKAIAAQQLADFEDGLNPELIDKGRAKERIRRMLVGEANMAELAHEIAGELASEMNMPLEQALSSARAGLGVSGATGGAGTDAAHAFQDGAMLGLAERNGGGAMVDTFAAQARANYSKLTTAGGDASRAWASGFMSNIEGNLTTPLINLLATLVTPQVMSQMAQQGTLSSAAP